MCRKTSEKRFPQKQIEQNSPRREEKCRFAFQTVSSGHFSACYWLWRRNRSTDWRKIISKRLLSEWTSNRALVISHANSFSYQLSSKINILCLCACSRSIRCPIQHDHQVGRITEIGCEIFGRDWCRIQGGMSALLLRDGRLQRVRLRGEGIEYVLSVQLWIAARFPLQIHQAQQLHQRYFLDEEAKRSADGRGSEGSAAGSDANDFVAERNGSEESSRASV